ncbi:sulfite exporter TauE/SafE family protein [Paenibacillus sp. 1011MAR3C5]|uniref:sulfite exporter TauE/SafE family protein n=1 Tax=Paenibacillus sp. 1011MAR3C5 TaxID=1675787 RepID=UPI000E6CC9A6|nr:sulfite exporter TauE/SafE family protein [Paenibacillus sp. 1011MAR3C5]RJE86862.1 sulfite exporter TauE/SafE family protein [Paenibacillus sp. 1011MAR3C5]
MSLSLNGVGLILLTGLFSAPHCIGMCGGIVSAVSLQSNATARRSMLLYNAGRIVSYALLGAMMGAVGSFVDVAGRFAGIRGLASIIGGCFVLLWLWRKVQIPFLNRLSGKLHQELASGARASGRKETAHLLATGFAFGFLPCGLTYAMGMNAAATGSLAEGAVVMALFGLATMPALVFAASIAALASKRWRRFMRRAGVVTAVAVGLISILRGLAANGIIPTVSPWLW